MTLIFPYIAISASPTNWAHYRRHREAKKISPSLLTPLFPPRYSLQIKMRTVARRYTKKDDTDVEMES
jgi:hypothetical protein